MKSSISSLFFVINGVNMQNNQSPQGNNGKNNNNSFFKKQWFSTKENFRILFDDIKFAYSKAYKSNIHQANNSEVIQSPGNSNAQYFKSQLEKFKIFWKSLTKKSKIYLTVFFIIAIYIISSGSDNSSFNTVPSNSSINGKNTIAALNCNTLDCNDHDLVVNAVRDVWLMARNSDIREVRAYENACFRGLSSLQNLPNHLLGSRSVYEHHMYGCNIVLHYINND